MTRREYLATGAFIPGRGSWLSLGRKDTLWLDLCQNWLTIQEWAFWQKRVGHRIWAQVGPQRRWYRGVPPRPWVIPERDARRLP